MEMRIKIAGRDLEHFEDIVRQALNESLGPIDEVVVTVTEGQISLSTNGFHSNFIGVLNGETGGFDSPLLRETYEERLNRFELRLDALEKTLTPQA
jgi:hypothetical protein